MRDFTNASEQEQINFLAEALLDLMNRVKVIEEKIKRYGL